MPWVSIYLMAKAINKRRRLKMSKEIGVCEAVLSSIKTRVDGSVTVSLEINPEEKSTISELMQAFLRDDKLLTVAFVAPNK
jgi:hypothetical protein